LPIGAASRNRPDSGRTLSPEALHLLPAITPDYRDTADALVHKDLRLAFDGNHYCVPPRYVGYWLTVKADAARSSSTTNTRRSFPTPAAGSA